MKLVVKKHSGFSLIELMIVVVIIGIIASVAVPSFSAYVENGRRAEGKAFALDLASRQERHYTQYSRYGSSLTATDQTGLGLPDINSENAVYSAEFTQPDGIASYLITLTPATADAKCGDLTLTNTGVRDKVGGTGTTAECWR